MKICEYANNLFDMTYLCDITEKDKKVAFRREDDFGYLMWIRINIHSIERVFPIIDKKHNKYLRLGRTLLYDIPYYYFTEALKLTPIMYIQFGDWI